MMTMMGELEDSFFALLFKRYINEDSGREKILERLKCNSSVMFDEALVNYDIDDIVHIGSGSYADVFRSEAQNYIFKLIRLLPEVLIDRIQTSGINRTTKYIEAYNEYQISCSLCKLHHGIIHKNTVYNCQMFPFIYQGYMTNDQLPSYFKVCNDNEDNSGGGGSCCDIFDDYFLQIPRENMMLIMEDCGEPMGDVIHDLPPFALISIIKQIITGFMIAEIVYEFEHRDLHSGNVLLQPYDQKYIRYIFRGKKITIPSYNYRVKIIDTTFSRIRIKQKIYHKDLSHLFENFNNVSDEEIDGKKMKMQDVTYQQMAYIIDNNWQNFYPKTNLIWIKYIIYKLLKSNSLHSPKEEFAKDAVKVQNILKLYNNLMDKCINSAGCFNSVIRDPTLNDCVKITMN